MLMSEEIGKYFYRSEDKDFEEPINNRKKKKKPKNPKQQQQKTMAIPKSKKGFQKSLGNHYALGNVCVFVSQSSGGPEFKFKMSQV